jgi:hypothetical protein
MARGTILAVMPLMSTTSATPRLDSSRRDDTPRGGRRRQIPSIFTGRKHPHTMAASPDSPTRYLYKGGRKLNDEYVIIKAHAGGVEAFTPPSSVLYVAYNMRTLRTVTLSMSAEELGVIVGAERLPQLFCDANADRQAAHQCVIDSLQFEDRLLAEGAKGGGEVSAIPMASLSPVKAAAAPHSPATPAAAPSAAAASDEAAVTTAVLRTGLKINGVTSQSACALPLTTCSRCAAVSCCRSSSRQASTTSLRCEPRRRGCSR